MADSSKQRGLLATQRSAFRSLQPALASDKMSICRICIESHKKYVPNWEHKYTLAFITVHLKCKIYNQQSVKQ